MRYLRALIAGVFLPSLILPFILIFAFSYGKPEVSQIESLHFIPLLWGFWNILYLALFKEIFPGWEWVKMLLAGALLGLLVAIVGVFWLRLPEALGLPRHLQLLPLVGAPIIYAVLWAFILMPLNKIVGIK
jgi:hypothetical protein